MSVVIHKKSTFSSCRIAGIGICGNVGYGATDVDEEVTCKLCLRELRMLADPRNTDAKLPTAQPQDAPKIETWDETHECVHGNDTTNGCDECEFEAAPAPQAPALPPLNVPAEEVCVSCYEAAVGRCESCDAPICADHEGNKYADVYECKDVAACSLRIDQKGLPQAQDAVEKRLPRPREWTPETIDETFFMVAANSPFYSALEKMLAKKLSEALAHNRKLCEKVANAEAHEIMAQTTAELATARVAALEQVVKDAHRIIHSIYPPQRRASAWLKRNPAPPEQTKGPEK